MAEMPVIPTDPEQALAAAVTRFYSAAAVSFDWLRFQVLDIAEWPILLQPVAEGLYAGVAVDVGPSYVRVTNDHLTGWGLTFEQLLNRAIDNSIIVRDISVQRRDGLAIIDDDLAVAGLFLRPDLTETLITLGHPVVLALTRTEALLASDQDPAALLLMAEYLLAGLKSGDAVIETALPQWWDGSRWWPLSWAQLGVEAARVAAIAHYFDLGWYSRQQEALTAWLKHTGQDVFPAAYKLFDRDGGQLSVAAWSDGVPSALPQTDQVQLIPADGREPLTLDWDLLVESYGHLMRPMGLVPERWQVDGWRP